MTEENHQEEIRSQVQRSQTETLPEARSEEAPLADESQTAQEPLENTEDLTHLVGHLEAILFAAHEPLTLREIKKIFSRLWRGLDADERAENVILLDKSLKLIKKKWSAKHGNFGFALVEIAGGLAFRTRPEQLDVLRAMRAEKPVRLSQAAMETLAIIAYRQPIAKPEADQIRGVDCAGTMKLLLERNLVRIMGRSQEPGRPSLYGTTRQFLNLFNLKSLSHLPTLQEFTELSEESLDEAQRRVGETISLADLSQHAKDLQLAEDPAVSALDDALAALKSSEKVTRQALHEQGIVLEENKEEPSTDEPPLPAEGSKEVTQIHEEPDAVSAESSDSSETNAA
jgi:segregation and condensation protein B